MTSLLALLILFGSAAGASPDLASGLPSAARQQVGVTVRYDGSYARLAFPGGDVPIQGGVCTDVLVRAYRKLGIDLQVLVHDDMTVAWTSYPRLWGLLRPDPSIDHRRVPNLATYFRRHGRSLPIRREGNLFSPGNVVTWRLASGLPHIGIVSDRAAPDGTPLVIHNIGAGVTEEDVLFAHVVTAQFRYPAGPDGVSQGPRPSHR